MQAPGPSASPPQHIELSYFRNTIQEVKLQRMGARGGEGEQVGQPGGAGGRRVGWRRRNL